MPKKLTTEEFFAAIKPLLPPNWSSLQPQDQLHHVLVASDDVLKPEGDWLLVNANLSLRELLAIPTKR